MSDAEIRSAVASGALDADGLAAACPAGTGCGGCRSVVEAIVTEVAVAVSVAA